MSAKAVPKWWEAPWRFLVEALTGAFIFAVIGSAAVGLNFLVSYLEKKDVDHFILYGLKGAEYGLFLVDLILFARFLWKTASRTWKDL